MKPNKVVNNIIRNIVFPIIAAGLVGCAPDGNEAGRAEVSGAVPEADAPPFDYRAKNADRFPGEWLLNGRDYKEQHFSPLDNINRNNVGDLGLAWFVDVPSDGGQESTPLMVDGTLYFSAAWSLVYAVDAATGKTLWSYDPKVPKATQAKACCGPVNRGVAYWDGKIYIGAFDGRLIALDAKTGEPVWSVDTIADNNNYSISQNYTITGAPRVAGDKIVIGNGGAEYGVRGYVTAYDAKTGEKAWRFYTVPGDPSKPFENPALEWAAETWHGEWWKVGGGGTAYDAMAYDPDLNLFYIGVGNSSPYNPNIRSQGKGDNLFVSSIVAVNADTGEYVWHYQTTPGDGWDYTATQHMIMAELQIGGATRKVIMQAPKNGFFYVLDRITGVLLSAEKFVPVTWASHVDMETGRPVVYEKARYWITGEPVELVPNAGGAHNWHPMAFHPETGLVYIPAMEISMVFAGNDAEEFVPLGRNTGMSYKSQPIPMDPKILAAIAKDRFKGMLLAWDPVQQKEVWRVEQKYTNAGGVLTTGGGLVFQGTVDGYFRALDAESGEQLWESNALTSVKAAPITYQVGDDQYIAVVVGRGGQLIGGRQSGPFGAEIINRSRLLVYKLGGDAQLPEPDEPVLTMQDLSDHSLDEARVEAGLEFYTKYCRTCHGLNAVGNSIVPDLRYSGFLPNHDLWQQVVKDGLLEQTGMVGFGSVMNAEEIESIRQYVVRQNQLSIEVGDTTRLGR